MKSTIMGWSSEGLLLTLRFNCELIMVFEKQGAENDFKVTFRLETDENGRLVSQKKTMKNCFRRRK